MVASASASTVRRDGMAPSTSTDIVGAERMAPDRGPMASARRARPLRAGVVALALAATSACGGAPGDARDARAAATCDEDDLGACEARLAEAMARGQDAKPLALAWLEARREA